MIFYQELDVFGAVSVHKKYCIFDYRRGSLNFQAFPWHLYLMSGHSLVELAEHDNSAADILVRSMCIYALLHS